MPQKLLLWEALKLITENPKREIKCSAGDLRFEDGVLIWVSSGKEFTIQRNKTGMWDTLTRRYFSIIEPPKELKKMSAAEMMKYYSLEVHNIEVQKIKSCVSGKTLYEIGMSRLTTEQIDGLWTVEGVFEEVETNG